MKNIITTFSISQKNIILEFYFFITKIVVLHYQCDFLNQLGENPRYARILFDI